MAKCSIMFVFFAVVVNPKIAESLSRTPPAVKAVARAASERSLFFRSATSGSGVSSTDRGGGEHAGSRRRKHHSPVRDPPNLKRCDAGASFHGGSFRYKLPSNEDDKAQEEFLKILDSGTLTDSLFTARYVNCNPKHKEKFRHNDCPHLLHVPAAFRMFDCLALKEKQLSRHPGKASCKRANPSSIYCESGMLTQCIDLIKKMPQLKDGEKRVLAFMGNSDDHLSKRGMIGSLKKIQSLGKISRILFEAKDITHPDVGTMPIGLSNFYTDLNGHANVLRAIKGASLQKKDKGLLAAWGLVNPGLDDKVASRKEAYKFVESSCLVNRTMLEPKEYFSEMARHRFLLAPTGHGVQTPKLTEALLVLTIPIVQRNPAFQDLVEKYGWPLALVDTWDEITLDKLEEWHTNLSPKLVAFRLQLTTAGTFAAIMRQ